MTTELSERIVKRFRKEALAVPRLDHGKTVESGMVRYHRFSEVIQATDLTNAGKRGKRCDVIKIRPTFNFKQSPAEREEQMRRLALLVEDYGDLRLVISTINDLNRDYPDAYEIERGAARGVDVAPAGFGVKRIQTPFVEIRVELKDFMIQNVADQDNLPTCVPAEEGGAKDLPVFYRWVTDNEASIRHMRYADILDQLKSLGIRTHSYCAN